MKVACPVLWVKVAATHQLIAAATTDTGLTVTCDLDGSQYPRSIKVSKAEMVGSLIAAPGEWNPRRHEAVISRRILDT